MPSRTILTMSGVRVWQAAPHYDEIVENHDIPWMHSLGTPYRSIEWQNFSSAPYKIAKASDWSWIRFTPVNEALLDRNIYTFAKLSNIAVDARNVIADVLNGMSLRDPDQLVYVARYGPPREFTLTRIPIGGDEP